jgi:LPS export ABC transporter protein LptC
MRYLLKLSYFLVLLSLSLAAGCNTEQSTNRTGTTEADSTILPDSEVTGATIYLYDEGRVTTRILAGRLLKFESIDSTIGYDLDIDFLDSLGETTSEVVGDSGVIREDTGLLHIFGNVVVTTRDGRTMETEHLRWNSATEMIETDAFVRITKDDNVTTGWGLETDKSLSRIRILKASGTIRDSGWTE